MEKNLRNTQRSLKDVERLLKLDPTNTELLAQKQRLLQQEIGQTEDKLKALREADKQAKAQLESGDLGQDKYDALQREIAETEQSLKSLQNQATKSKSLSEGLRDFGDSASSAADKTKGLSTAAGGLLGAMAATVPATEELRTDLSKLDNNARDAGVGIDETRSAFEAFNVVSDEVDSSVEATSNLLQAGFTESNLQKAVEGLSGAYLRFPDTLKIESLADSLQETLATGQATGQFGELLDRLGIGAKNFSDKLSELSTDAERQNYALQTLADAGLMDTYNGWKENNSALVESKQASMEFQQSIAQLAETLTPIVTKITEFATKAVVAFNSLPSSAQSFILIIIGITAALSPLLSVVGNLSRLLGSAGLAKAFTALGTVAKTVLGFLTTGLKALFTLIMAHPVVAVVTVIITAVVLLYNKCEWFRDGVHAVIEAVSGFFKNLGQGISDFAKSAAEFISSGVSSIISFFGNLKNNAVNIFKSIKSTVGNIINNIKTTAVNGFKNMVNGIRSALSKVTSAVTSGFQGAIDFITSLPGKAISWGKDFINGLKDGIMSGVKGIVSAVKGIGDKIRSFLHFSRPDEGPLRDYETWMPDFMKGLANSIDRNVYRINDAMNRVSEAMYREFGENRFAEAASSELTVINNVGVNIGNRNFEEYIVKTASKGIGANQKKLLRARGK